MSGIVCYNNLEADIFNSRSIFDIVAAASKAFGIYSPRKISGYTGRNYRELIEIILDYDQCCARNPDGAFFRLREGVLCWLASRKVITSLDLYALIYNIDRNHLYSSPVVSFSGRAGSCHDFSALNDTSATTLRVLPRLHDTLTEKADHVCRERTGNGFRQRGTGESDTLNSELKNYDILDSAHEDFPPIIHRFTDSAAGSVMSRLRGKGGCLTIGMFPLWGGNTQQTLDIGYTENTFFVNGVFPEQEALLRERFFSSLNRCMEVGADIAIFPEMIMTRKILKDIVSHIALIPEDKLPVLMVMGTIWENEKSNERNVSVVLSCFGDILFEQHKQSPFILKKPGHVYKEDIKGHREGLSLKDKNVHIVDIPGTGRFFTHICLDVLNEKLISLSKRLRADVVLAPAFSLSRELKRELKALTEGYWSVALLCNACSALYATGDSWIPEKTIEESIDNQSGFNENSKTLESGFVLLPAKHSTEQVSDIFPLYMSESCKACRSKGCPGHIFDINFGNFLPPDTEKHFWHIDCKERRTARR